MSWSVPLSMSSATCTDGENKTRNAGRKQHEVKMTVENMFTSCYVQKLLPTSLLSVGFLNKL